MLKLVPTLGLGTTLQALPSQCSTSVPPGMPGATAHPPTAQTSVADTVATPRREHGNPGHGAPATSLQVLPSQCCITGWLLFPLKLLEVPTAHTLVADTA